MELYIIRHAQSTNNAIEWLNPKDRVGDPPLTELGHQQAEALAHYLCDGFNPEAVLDGLYAKQSDARQRHGYQFTKLYCSPMHRSLQTTAPVAREMGLHPQVWADIHEHGGIYLEHEDERGVVGYGGKTRAEIESEFPGYVMTDDITDTGWWTGKMEDITTAYGRATKVAMQLRKEAKESPNDRIAIVSHGTFVDALIKALFNQLPSRQMYYAHFNTAMTRIDFNPDGYLHFRYLNRVHHLTAEMVT
jgi:2,3-bisphosphoglycerate-dependent phosphoglycerate mutase